MKLQVTLGTCLVLLLLAPMSSVATAQDGVPTAVSQVHTYQWEWGYIGVQPMFGFWLGDRFNEADLENPALGGYANDTFSQQPLFGSKVSLGFGSNLDTIGTEFHFSILREGYSGTRIADGADVTIDQLVGRFGFNFIVEFVSNENITAAGEVQREPLEIALTGYAGFTYLFFPDNDFDLAQGTQLDDITIEDDTLWLNVGILLDVPFSNELTLSGFLATDFFVYRLERAGFLQGLVGDDQDRGTYTFENVTERMQIHFGSFITFTPFFDTHGGHHWRFYFGANYSLNEDPLTDTLMFSVGANFGW